MNEIPLEEKHTARLFISCTPQQRKTWLEAFGRQEFSREMRRLIKSEVKRLKEEALKAGVTA